MRLVRSILVVVVLALVLPAPSAGAQEVGPVDVLDVSGPLDERGVRFLVDTVVELAEGDGQVVILQLDSAGVITDELGELIALVEDPPIPLVVWVGPDPAVGYGGVVDLLAAAPLRAVSPGVEIGFRSPTVAGRPGLASYATAGPPALNDRVETIEGPVDGLIDIAPAALGEIVLALDGRSFVVGGGTRVLSTVEQVTNEQGESEIRPTAQVRFRKPGALTRLLRLAVRPEGAFFFLVVGLTVAAFEFYAIGPGIAAGVALLSLLLAGYGIANLPMHWWAFGLVLAGLGMVTAEFQRGTYALLTALGTVMMVVGGLWFTATHPQFPPRWWAVLLTTGSAVAFYLIAMPTVARSRFATTTIGREYLVGRPGRAVGDFTPDGIVEVDGARWRAEAHREAGISDGDALEVTEVQGIVLGVDRIEAGSGA